MDEIELRISDDYCQGSCTDYIWQSPPEELKVKTNKLKSIKVKRDKKTK